MKRCPSCKQTYSDSEDFCPTDGVGLIAAASASVPDETIKGRHLAIKLDSPADYYLPGDAIRGTVTVSTEDELKINKISVALMSARSYRVLRYKDDYQMDGANPTYETTHMVTEDADVRLVAQAGKVPALTTSSYEFHFTIPADASPTSEADIVNVYWVIAATVNIPWAYDLLQKQWLTVASAPPGKRLAPGVFGEMNDPEDDGTSALMSPLGLSRRARGNAYGLKMRLRLPKLEFLEGETFDGSLLLELREGLECDGISVALVRSECALDGNVPNYRRGTAQVVSLTPATAFEGGEATHEYPFSLTIPTGLGVSQSDSHGYVKWEVVGMFDRAVSSRNNYEVSQEIEVYSVPPRPGDAP